MQERVENRFLGGRRRRRRRGRRRKQPIVCFISASFRMVVGVKIYHDTPDHHRLDGTAGSPVTHHGPLSSTSKGGQD
jgi:hypothetical protein